MNNVKFVFYHPDLDLLSDRTIRSLLKSISATLREIQYQEVFFLINTSNASPSEKQSMRDRLKGQLNHIEAYYLERLEKGSIELTITLTAFGVWLLQQTIGESIKEAWLKSDMHKDLVDYLSSDRRKVVLDRNIDTVLSGWRFDNYTIDDMNKVVDDQGDINVKVILGTPFEVTRRIESNSGIVNLDSIISESKKIIAHLDDLDD